MTVRRDVAAVRRPPEQSHGARLAALLRAVGYGTEATSIDDPYVALLVRGVAVSVAELTAAGAATLIACGAADRRGDELVPLLRVDAWNDLFVAHDPDRPGELVADTVLGVNNTTRTLATLTPRRRVHRALDVATGSGGPALLLTGHADEVVATDLSERAVRYAALNAAMNDRHLDLRCGSLFDPVAGDEPFDLITANLPFVVSPDATFTFRDGGRRADELCREAVAGASRLLTDGGTAVLLCSWLVPDGCQPASAIDDWLGPHDGAALVVHHSTVDPEAYARRWNEYLLVQDPAAYAPTIDRWMAAHTAWGAAGVATGAVVLRSGTSRWTRSFDMTVAPQGEGGRQLERIIANVERLRSSGIGEDAGALGRERLALVASHRLEQAMRYDGAWAVEDVRMLLADSAGIPGLVDPLAVHALFRLDGRTPVDGCIDAVANELGIDALALRTATLTSCHHLLAAGCLDIA